MDHVLVACRCCQHWTLQLQASTYALLQLYTCNGIIVLQVKALEEEAERAAEAEQATLAAMRRDAEDTQVRLVPSYTLTHLYHIRACLVT